MSATHVPRDSSTLLHRDGPRRECPEGSRGESVSTRRPQTGTRLVLERLPFYTDRLGTCVIHESRTERLRSNHRKIKEGHGVGSGEESVPEWHRGLGVDIQGPPPIPRPAGLPRDARHPPSGRGILTELGASLVLVDLAPPRLREEVYHPLETSLFPPGPHLRRTLVLPLGPEDRLPSTPLHLETTSLLISAKSVVRVRVLGAPTRFSVRGVDENLSTLL